MGKIMLNGIPYAGSGSGGGTSNYNELSNKPSINGIPLVGNKTSEDLGISGGGGTSNYSALTNKPSINGVTLDGNKTAADLGLDASNLIDNSTLVVDENGKIAIGEVSNDDIASLFS